MQNKLNLVYFGHVEVPSKRAYAVNMMHMCDSLSKYFNVKLLALFAQTNISIKQIRDKYNVSSDFKISLLKVPKIYFFESLIFVFKGFSKIIFKSKIDIIYSRDLLAAFIGIMFGFNVLFEAHMPLKKKRHIFLFKLISGFKKFKLICISNSLSKKYKLDFLNLDSKKIIILPDGAKISNKPKKNSLNKNNNYENISYGYVGNLFKGKGMEIIAPLSWIMKDRTFHIIGGNQRDITYWKKKCNFNVIFYGFVDQKQLNNLYNNFDIALLPLQPLISPDGGDSNIAKYTSPMKMFEYISHQKLIVSSNLPVLLEVLKNDFNSIIIQENIPEAWYEKLIEIENDKDRLIKLTSNAYEELINLYSWDVRASRLVNFISNE